MSLKHQRRFRNKSNASNQSNASQSPSSNFDAFGFTTENKERSLSVPVQARGRTSPSQYNPSAFSSSLTQAFRRTKISNSLHRPSNHHHDRDQHGHDGASSSCVSIESRESLDDGNDQQQQFHITNIIQMYEGKGNNPAASTRIPNDRRQRGGELGRQVGRGEIDPHQFITNSSKKPKSKESRIRQAEIENVILKQMLSSKRFYENDTLDDDDDGHFSVATGAYSTVSQYTTKDILGDLTDHEDTKSVHSSKGGGRRSRSRSKSSRIRSSSTKSRRQQDQSINDSALVEKKQVRSKSVVSRRIRLKDADQQGSMADESLKLYDSFMKNLTKENTVYEAKRKFKESNAREQREKVSNTTSENSHSTWDPFATTSKTEDDFFGSKPSFHHSSTTSEIMKPTFSRISSLPLPSFGRSKTPDKLTKPTLERFSSAPVYNNPTKSISNRHKSSATEVDFGNISSTFKQSLFNRHGEKHTNSTPTLPKVTERSVSNHLSTRPSAIYSFPDFSPSIKKSRPKQFMEERSTYELSPVNRVKSPSVNTHKSAQESWTAFDNSTRSPRKQDISVQNINKNASNGFNISWSSFTDKQNRPSQTHEKTFKGESLDSFQAHKWKNEENPLFASQNVEESIDSCGFKVVKKTTKKSISNYSSDLSKDFGNDKDQFQSSSFQLSGSWDDHDFDDAPTDEFSSDDWREDLHESFGEVSKLSTSTISYRGSPTSLRIGGKTESSDLTHPTASTSCRSLATSSSSDSLSFSKFRASPKSFSKESGSQLSGWTDISPSGVADFNSSSRKTLFRVENR